MIQFELNVLWRLRLAVAEAWRTAAEQPTPAFCQRGQLELRQRLPVAARLLDYPPRLPHLDDPVRPSVTEARTQLRLFLDAFCPIVQLAGACLRLVDCQPLAARHPLTACRSTGILYVPRASRSFVA